MACGCEGKKYSISMGCCQPVLGPIENYYTKYQIDEMLEEIEQSGCCITEEEVDEKIESAMTEIESEIPSLSGYATEQWVLDKHYLTEHQPLKTINGQVISGSGNIVIECECESGITSGEVQTMINNSISGKQDTLIAGDNILITNNVISASGCDCDLSNYYNKQEVDAKIPSLNGYATEQWVLDKHYISGVDLSDYVTYEDMVEYVGDVYTKTEVNNLFVTKNTFNTYITNLQQQINSLIAAVSGCCGSTGETVYRWIVVPNDYTCSGTTKMTKEKQQSSTDGGMTWVDTSLYRVGSTVLEYNSSDCGYDPNKGLKITLNDDTVITYDCEELETITCSGQTKYKLTHTIVMSALTSPSDVKRIDIGTCVDLIGADAFSGLTNLQKVVIPSSFKNKRTVQCDGIDVNSFEKTAIRTVGMQGSGADVEWNDNMDDMASEMFKGCTSLTSVELHSGFGTFDPYVFSGCTNLQSIILHSTTLPVLNSYAQSGYQYDALDGIGNNTFVIYVPSNMVDTYKNAVDASGYKNWSKYANHIQAIP